MPSSQDIQWLRLALSEAERGRGRVEPNPMVGAVLVKGNEAIGLGHHTAFGSPHAEVEALRNCRDSADGATLYVTLEPCSHYGKTPPCSQAVIQAGIRRVVVAVADPNPLVNGCGIQQMQQAGLIVELLPQNHEIAKAAFRLNLPFFKKLQTGRPFVTAKWAMTLDGRMALASGDSRWISSRQSRSLVHELRGQMDAIMVGIGTVRHDNPLLTVRPTGRRTPVRVIVDSHLKIPKDSLLIQTLNEAPVWILTSEMADRNDRHQLEKLGVRVSLVEFDPGGHLIPEKILDLLGAEGMTNLLLEGGARLLGSFFDAQCIDEVQVYVAPVLFGGTPDYVPLQGSQNLVLDQVSRLLYPERKYVENDVLIKGLLATPWLNQHTGFIGS